MQPEEIPVDEITHLNVAFGYVNPSDYSITPMPGTTGGRRWRCDPHRDDAFADIRITAEMFKRITQLKAQNGNVKILIALGGWTFTDPGSYRTVFSNMVSSSTNRARFIKQLLLFLSTYGFDGVDFDWVRRLHKALQ